MVLATIGCLGLIVALFAGVIITGWFLACCVFFIVLGLVLDFAPWPGDRRGKSRISYRRD